MATWKSHRCPPCTSPSIRSPCPTEPWCFAQPATHTTSSRPCEPSWRSSTPNLPLFGVTTLEERHFAATARTRIILGLLASFALAGLLLSAIGLYGLVSQGVVARTREVGLRIALGADRASVLRMLAARPAALVVVSIAMGVGAAWWASGYLGALLFGTSPRAPETLLASALLLALVTAAATWVPASRATRLRPSMTLRD